MGVVLRLTGVTDLPFYYFFPLTGVLGAGLGLTDLSYLFFEATFEVAFLGAIAETDLFLCKGIVRAIFILLYSKNELEINIYHLDRKITIHFFKKFYLREDRKSLNF